MEVVEDVGLITCERMVYRPRVGVIDIGDGVPGRVQVECGREEVHDREKQEKDKHEETDNERSSTYHG